MLYKMPQPEPTKITGTARWSSEYTVFLSNEMYPLTFDILHTLPAYDVLDMSVNLGDALKDHHSAEYAQQIVAQQGLAEFKLFAEKHRTIPGRPKSLASPASTDFLFDGEDES